MTRTAVISDLHLGAYSGMAALLAPTVAGALFERLGDYDRLVLLGDTLELGERRPTAEVIQIAAPVLAGLGNAVSEIVLVPGNHDRLLVRGWIAEQGNGLALESTVPPDASPLLAETVGRLEAGGAAVSVRYAGFSLSDTVWMTHGHYLDRLLSPEIPYGRLRHAPRYAPVDYEGRARGRSGGLARDVVKRLLRPRLAPLLAAALDRQMRHDAMPALAAALGALGLRADHVVFGHVHRLGPLPNDRPGDWEHVLAPGAAPTRFFNSGSWQNEPLLVGARGAGRRYWPGGAVVIESDGIPRAVRLLDESQLRAGIRR